MEILIFSEHLRSILKSFHNLICWYGYFPLISSHGDEIILLIKLFAVRHSLEFKFDVTLPQLKLHNYSGLHTMVNHPPYSSHHSIYELDKFRVEIILFVLVNERLVWNVKLVVGDFHRWYLCWCAVWAMSEFYFFLDILRRSSS